MGYQEDSLAGVEVHVEAQVERAEGGTASSLARSGNSAGSRVNLLRLVAVEGGW